MTTLPDLSGNGRDATVGSSTDYVPLKPGPFAGGAQNYAVFHPNTSLSTNVPYATAPASTTAWNGSNVSADAWLWMSTPGNTTTGLFGWFDVGANNNWLGVNLRGNSTDPYDVKYDTGGSSFTNSELAIASLGAWHHIAVTWDGSNIRIYTDGTLKTTEADTITNTGRNLRPAFGGNSSFGVLRGYSGPVAFYTTTLTATQIGNHAAANSTFAVYKAAVLTDSPAGFWNTGALQGIPPSQGWLVNALGMRRP